MERQNVAHKNAFDHCTLDEARGVLISRDGVETTLRPKTLEVLTLLLLHPGRVVTRQEMREAVWPGSFVTDASISQCVAELRRGMGEAGAALRTVSRRGYLLQSRGVPDAPRSMLAMLPPPVDERPSIAVLPFRKDRVDPEDAYFADGIIEGIVHALSGLDQLFVISRGSALAIAQVSLDARVAGRELGARYVLYGGVRRAGSRLRIRTELTDTERGTILRDDCFDGDCDNLFDLQDRIAERIIAIIAPEVSAHELALALGKQPANLTAYDLVLRALDEIRRFDLGAMTRARALLDQAMIADPESALPHRYIAWWYTLRIAQCWAKDVDAEAKAAGQSAELALERDRNDAYALGLRGFLRGYMEHDFDAARRLLDRAVAARPSLAMAWSWGAAVRCWLAQGADAVTWAERGLRLAPLDPFSFFHEHILAMAHYTHGDFARAVTFARASSDANPRHVPNSCALIASLVADDRMSQACQEVARLRAMEPNFTLAGFSRRTPLQGEMRDVLVARLRAAGLPD